MLATEVMSQISTYLSYHDLYNLFLTGERQMRCSVVQAAHVLDLTTDAFSKFPYTAFSMRSLRSLSVTCNTSDYFGPFTFSADSFSRWGPCKSLEKLAARFWQSFEVLHPGAQLSWCCPNLKHLELVGATVALRESMLWDLPAGLEVLILKNLVCSRLGHLLDASSVLPLLPRDLYRLELPTLDTTLVDFEGEAEKILPKNLRILRLENLNESRILMHLPPRLEECYFSLAALTTTAAPSELSGGVLPRGLRIFAEEPLLGLVVLDVDDTLPPELEVLSVQVNLRPSVLRLHHVFPSTLRRLPSNIVLPPYNHHPDLEFGDLYLDYSKFPCLRSVDASKFEKKMAASLLAKIWSSCHSLTALNLGSHRLDRMKGHLEAAGHAQMDVDTEETSNPSCLGLAHLPNTLQNLSLTIGDIHTFRDIPPQLEKLVIIGGSSSEFGNFLHGCAWSCFLPQKLTSLKVPQEFIFDAATVNAILARCATLKSLDCGMRQNLLEDPKLLQLQKEKHSLEKLIIWGIGVELDELPWFENMKHFGDTLRDLSLDIQGSQHLKLAKHLALLPRTLQRLTMNLRATFEVDALSNLPDSLFGLKLSISCPPNKDLTTLSNEHFSNLPKKLYFLKVDIRGVSRVTKHVVCLLPLDLHYMNITTHDREQRALLLAIRRYYECNPKKWAGYVPPHLTPGLHPLRCYFPAEY